MMYLHAGYSTFVTVYRKALSSGKRRDDSVKIAVLECKRLGYLTNFFDNFKIEELVNMIGLEYNPELERKVLLEEGREEGRVEGREEVAIELIKSGMPINNIIALTSIPRERLLELKKHQANH